jgi:hypothetical protein
MTEFRHAIVHFYGEICHAITRFHAKARDAIHRPHGVMLMGAFVVMLAAVWIFLNALDYWSIPQQLNPPQMQEPTYNVASLPHLSGGQTLDFSNVKNKPTEQPVQVWSGGKKLAEYDLTHPDAELIIPLGELTLSSGIPVILGFYLPDAQRQVGNPNDARVFGLYFHSL